MNSQLHSMAPVKSTTLDTILILDSTAFWSQLCKIQLKVDLNFLIFFRIAIAWFVQGNVSSPAPTGEPPTTTTTRPIVDGPMDCEMAYDTNDYTESQIIRISLTNGETAKGYCEYDARTKTVQTVFQSRGSTNAVLYPFENKEYDDYLSEFGTAGIDHNYWMGLDNLNAFTTGRSKRYNMTIIACCGDQMKVFQTYSNVTVSLLLFGLSEDVHDFLRFRIRPVDI